MNLLSVHTTSKKVLAAFFLSSLSSTTRTTTTSAFLPRSSSTNRLSVVSSQNSVPSPVFLSYQNTNYNNVNRPRSYVTSIPRGGSSTTTSTTTIYGGATSTTTSSSSSSTATDEEQNGTVVVATSSTEVIDDESSAYRQLVAKLETITQLSRASAVLSYDQLVFMPSKAASERGSQLAALATIIHERKTDPTLLSLMEESLRELSFQNQHDGTNKNKNNNNNDDDALRWIELERKAFIENQNIPTELAAKAASLGSSAYSDWITAKQAKDFAMFVPTLQDCFDTSMALAKAKRGDNNNNNNNNNNNIDDDPSSLYGQMLDEFEVGMSQGRIDTIFDEVKEALVPLIGKVLQSKTEPSVGPFEGVFDVEKQRALSQQLVTAIGFDLDRGRIDMSVHPFSISMSAADVRITSRFRQDEWCQGLSATLHEGGHAIYEQNLASTSSPTTLSSLETALSMGTHESQSLFWERHIGLSKPFWTFARPQLVESFESLGKYSVEEIYGAVNRVSQSLIRVEADELTYPLHVILRYTIEKEVVAGQLQVADINQRWKTLMKELLGIDVPSDDKGALQDVHWSGLAIGYFPTYLIGAIAAAQLYYYCEQQIPDLEGKIESGDFAPIKGWLKNKVHRHGRRYPSLDAMFEDQLGEPLNPTYFITYLTNKYTDLYKLS
jgi:carboxypeptidase Taq